MNAKKIKLGMIGGGHSSFIGILHRIAAYITEDFEFVGGVFDSNFEDSKKFAKDLGLPLDRTYPTIEEFIAGERAFPTDEQISTVIIVTPNFLHYPMARSLAEAGFNIICEKPMTMSVDEAIELEALVARKNIVFALTHTYTGYPMVRQMRTMIEEGVIGKIQKVDAQYYQGWINPIIHDKAQRNTVWRLDPKKAGISSCLGDIGVHAFNMIEYTTGLKTQRILADLNNLYADNPLDVDGTVLLRLDNDVHGIVRSSQIATGEENNLNIAVYGTKGGLKWEQENPNYLYRLQDGKPMETLKPGQPYMSKFAADSTKMVPGHPEGIFDSMGNIYKGAARAILGQSTPAGAFPTVHDGVRGMKFIQASIESSQSGNTWITIND